MTSGSEPRLIDLIFDAHARLRAAGREHGVRSAGYAAVLDELGRLRQLREEERAVRRF